MPHKHREFFHRSFGLVLLFIIHVTDIGGLLLFGCVIRSPTMTRHNEDSKPKCINLRPRRRPTEKRKPWDAQECIKYVKSGSACVWHELMVPQVLTFTCLHIVLIALYYYLGTTKNQGKNWENKNEWRKYVLCFAKRNLLLLFESERNRFILQKKIGAFHSNKHLCQVLLAFVFSFLLVPSTSLASPHCLRLLASPIMLFQIIIRWRWSDVSKTQRMLRYHHLKELYFIQLKWRWLERDALLWIPSFSSFPFPFFVLSKSM